MKSFRRSPMRPYDAFAPFFVFPASPPLAAEVSWRAEAEEAAGFS